MAKTLYLREKQVLQFLSQYMQRTGCAPTLTEIAEAIGVNAVSTIHEHLERLQKKGFIKRTAGYERGIELTENVEKVRFDNLSAIELPVLGFIAAGSPIEPHTDPNLYQVVPANFINAKKPGYILQVKGNSMIEDGILDGDFVVVQHQQEAKNGELVVATLPNGFATLKKIYFEKDRIKLSPANSEMTPIYTTRVKIQGKVVAVFRKFTN